MKLTLDEAVEQLAKIIDEQLSKLPPKERRLRTVYAHNRLLERLAIEAASKRNDTATQRPH